MADKYVSKDRLTYFWGKVKSYIATHTGNTTIHITATERTNWNAAKNATVASEAGANGLRYYNGKLQVKSGNSWVSISLDGFPLNNN